MRWLALVMLVVACAGGDPQPIPCPGTEIVVDPSAPSTFPIGEVVTVGVQVEGSELTVTVPPPAGGGPPSGASVDASGRSSFTVSCSEPGTATASLTTPLGNGSCFIEYPIVCGDAPPGDCIASGALAGTFAHTARANDCGQTDYTVSFTGSRTGDTLDVTFEGGVTASGNLDDDCSTTLTTSDDDTYTLQCDPDGCAGTLDNTDDGGCLATFDVDAFFDEGIPEFGEIVLVDDGVCGGTDRDRLGEVARAIGLDAPGNNMVVLTESALLLRAVSDFGTDLATADLPAGTPANAQLAGTQILYGPNSPAFFHIGSDLSTSPHDANLVDWGFTVADTCMGVTPSGELRCFAGDATHVAAAACEVSADSFTADVVATVDRGGLVGCVADDDVGRVLLADGTVIDFASDGTTTNHASPPESFYVSIHATGTGVALRGDPEADGGRRTRIDVATGFGASYTLRTSVVRENVDGVAVAGFGADRLVIGTGRFDGDLYLIDLGEPTNILQVGVTPLSSPPTAGVCTDTLCYFIGEDNLFEVDFSDCE